MSGARAVKCRGCECNVPLVGEMHAEESEVQGYVYAYACTAPERVKSNADVAAKAAKEGK